MSKLYNDSLNPGRQIAMEEMISSMIDLATEIPDYLSGSAREEMFADLGRSILIIVLTEFRPDLLSEEA